MFIAREVSIQVTNEKELTQSVHQDQISEGQESSANVSNEPVAVQSKTVKRKVIEQVEVVIDVPFLSIDDAEVVITDRYDLETQNYKVQAVLLPFERDLGGVKIAFKGINLDEPTFQNELIHIDLDQSEEALLADPSKVANLIK